VNTSVYSLCNLLNVDRIFIGMKNGELSNKFGQYHKPRLNRIMIINNNIQNKYETNAIVFGAYLRH